MISIIVPVYNVQNYLGYCIDSILAQTYQNFELILVNDGSTDDSGKICERYAQNDHRIRIIHQKNGGVSVARNTGLAAVRGEYVSMIDSDDLAHPFYLEHLLRGLTENKADICICWFAKFSDEDVPAYVKDQPYVEKRIMTGTETCLNIYSKTDRVSIAPYLKLYKSELFDGIQYPVGRIHEDEAVTPQIFYKAAKVVELDEVLYFYRQRSCSIMNDLFSIKRYDALKALQERYFFFVEREEKEIAMATQQAFETVKAKYSIRARASGIYDAVPSQYKMSVLRALKVIWKNSDPENFEWFLSLVFPRLVKPYEFYVKIKMVLKRRVDRCRGN